MASDFRLGSISGFEIRIDYSWFIIFFLILWMLSSGSFPATVPGLGEGVYIAMGVAGTLLFFLSLLGHELSHSVVARLKGIEVAGITLFIFGGMAHTTMEAERPGDEFLIAGVGPLSSLIIAAGFWLIYHFGLQADWPAAIVVVAGWLWQINVLLALFNLLPGFPLDGGRLFRSAVWKISGSLDTATRWATNGGKLLGYALMAFGAYSALRGDLIGGLWLVFIGWFVRNAAASSYRQHRVTSVLSAGRAADVMTPDPETVPPDLRLQDLADDYFLQRRYHGFPVVAADGSLLGVVTLDQLKTVPRMEWALRNVASIMTGVDAGIVVEPDAPLQAVIDALHRTPARRALVVDSGRLLGLVTVADVNDWLQHVRQAGGA